MIWFNLSMSPHFYWGITSIPGILVKIPPLSHVHKCWCCLPKWQGVLGPEHQWELVYCNERDVVFWDDYLHHQYCGHFWFGMIARSTFLSSWLKTLTDNGDGDAAVGCCGEAVADSAWLRGWMDWCSWRKRSSLSCAYLVREAMNLCSAGAPSSGPGGLLCLSSIAQAVRLCTFCDPGLDVVTNRNTNTVKCFTSKPQSAH